MKTENSPKAVEDKPDNSVNLVFGLFVLLSEPHLLANLTISLGHMEFKLILSFFFFFVEECLWTDGHKKLFWKILLC